jgi:tetratricopeptide (TPR) repeat protein
MKRERKPAHVEQKEAGSAKQRIDKRNTRPQTVIKKANITTKVKLLWISILAGVTLIAYIPAFNNQITSWDDEFYVNTNPYLKDLSFKTIGELFKTDTYYMGNYHPLSMLSLSIDYALGGEDENGNIHPFMFHFTNILLHILISVLVFITLLALFKKLNLAIIAGLLFGLHALHVESVAWISERKDVLYAFFFVLSLLAYIHYVDKKKPVLYLASLLLFLLSLFSKGQAVSLAVTLIVVDYLRNRNLLDKKVILEKVPFFVLSIIFGYLAIQAQKQSEALVDEQAYSMVQRFGIASYAFVQYILKLVMPVNLSAIYPYTDIINHTVPGYYYLMLVPVILLIVLFFYLIKKQQKELVFGMAFFVVNIVLLLQFIPVGSAVYADRYAYVPSIGFFILAALLIEKLIRKPKLKMPVMIGIGAYALVLGVLTFQRTEVWKDSATLWSDTVKKSPGAVIAWNNLGSHKDKEASKALLENRFEEAKQYRLDAIKDFSRAIAGKPDYKNAYFNRGVSRFEVGKLMRDSILIKSAIDDFNKSLEIDAQFADAYFNRANAKSELNQIENALKDYNIAISMNPENSDYYANRGVAYGKGGKIDEAILDFDKALEMKPEESSIYSNRGRAKMLKGDVDGAIVDYNRSIELNPTNYTAYFNRAIAKQRVKDYEGAKTDFEQTLLLRKDMGEVYYQRGLLYLEINDRENACQDFETARQMGIAYAEILMAQFCK